MSTNVNLEDDYAAREQVCGWLRANGVDPARTPMYPQASISDGQLTIRQKVRHNGHDVISIEDPNTIMEETITVPVLVEPSGVVAAWLAPRCPTCGR
jgi:hypothetical protein